MQMLTLKNWFLGLKMLGVNFLYGLLLLVIVILTNLFVTSPKIFLTIIIMSEFILLFVYGYLGRTLLGLK